MYTRRNIRWSVIFRLAWKKVLIFSAWSVFVTLAYLQLKTIGVDCSLPIAPLGTIGVAVAFYIGFKNNQSYDRNWEARKIWGGIVNVSRTWANQVITFISANHTGGEVDEVEVKKIHQSLVYRHLAWINTLRFQLRRETPFGFRPRGSAKRYTQLTSVEAMKEQLSSLLHEAELTRMCSKANAATQILRQQSEELRHVIESRNLTEEFRYIALMDLITEMYSLQGKCERIKNTPFPRQYAYFSGVFTWIFIVLLPFGLVGEIATRGDYMAWLTVPVTVIICWIFYTMESVGDSSEDPFENFINDIPMTALCRTIEIDLRQMLGETDLPPAIKPENDILM